MDVETVQNVKGILDESVRWNVETLQRMPRMFLLVRQSYLDVITDS